MLKIVNYHQRPDPELHMWSLLIHRKHTGASAANQQLNLNFIALSPSILLSYTALTGQYAVLRIRPDPARHPPS